MSKLNFNQMPIAVRQRFVQLTQARQDPRVVHHEKEGAVWLWLVLMGGLALGLTVPLMAVYGGLWITVPAMVALCSVGPLFILTASLSIVRSHPFVAGKWIFAGHAVLCNSNKFELIRFTTSTKFVAVTKRTRRESGGTSTSYSVKIQNPGEADIVLRPRRESAASLAQRLSQANASFQMAWGRGDHHAIQQMSPFYEHLMGQQATAPEMVQEPHMRGIPKRLDRAVRVFTVLGALVGGLVGFVPYYRESSQEDWQRERDKEHAAEKADAEKARKKRHQDALDNASSKGARAFLKRMLEAKRNTIYWRIKKTKAATSKMHWATPSTRTVADDLNNKMRDSLRPMEWVTSWLEDRFSKPDGPVMLITRIMSPTDTQHPTAEGDVQGFQTEFQIRIEWPSDGRDQPAEVMVETSVVIGPPKELPTNLSAKATYEKMALAQHHAFAEGVFQLLVNKTTKRKKTKKRKKR